MVCDDNKVVGFFYIDKNSDTVYESSSSGVISDYAGKGICTLTVQWQEEIIRLKGGKQIFTWISENNVASWKRFEKLGYKRTEEYEIKELPSFNRSDKFYKWIKNL